MILMYRQLGWIRTEGVNQDFRLESWFTLSVRICPGQRYNSPWSSSNCQRDLLVVVDAVVFDVVVAFVVVVVVVVVDVVVVVVIVAVVRIPMHSLSFSSIFFSLSYFCRFTLHQSLVSTIDYHFLCWLFATLLFQIFIFRLVFFFLVKNLFKMIYES